PRGPAALLRPPPRLLLRPLPDLPLPALLLTLLVPRLRRTSATPSVISNAAAKSGTRGNDVTCERAWCTASGFRGDD
ncbi:MAG TPA: hypothetical protein VGD55_08925, partial [Acidothermaceae bacterium]